LPRGRLPGSSKVSPLPRCCRRRRRRHRRRPCTFSDSAGSTSRHRSVDRPSPPCRAGTSRVGSSRNPPGTRTCPRGSHSISLRPRTVEAVSDVFVPGEGRLTYPVAEKIGALCFVGRSQGPGNSNNNSQAKARQRCSLGKPTLYFPVAHAAGGAPDTSATSAEAWTRKAKHTVDHIERSLPLHVRRTTCLSVRGNCRGSASTATYHCDRF
jgi:hypothetical protein